MKVLVAFKSIPIIPEFKGKKLSFVGKKAALVQRHVRHVTRIKIQIWMFL